MGEGLRWIDTCELRSGEEGRLGLATQIANPKPMTNNISTFIAASTYFQAHPVTLFPTSNLQGILRHTWKGWSEPRWDDDILNRLDTPTPRIQTQWLGSICDAPVFSPREGDQATIA